MMDADYKDDQGLLENLQAQAKCLLYSLKQSAMNSDRRSLM